MSGKYAILIQMNNKNYIMPTDSITAGDPDFWIGDAAVYDSSFQEFVNDLSLTTRNKLPYNLGTYDNALKLCNYFKEQKRIFNKDIKLSKRECVVFRIISGQKAASLLPPKSFKYKKDRHIRRADIRCNSHDLTARREIRAYYREQYKIKHNLLTKR